MNQCLVVNKTPHGQPVESDFALRETAEPAGNGVLCQTRFISVDPYLRGRLSGRHLTGAIMPGQAMDSELLVELLEDSDHLAAGSLARCFGPWQNRVRLPSEQLLGIDATVTPASLALGVLGMPGLTAYAGINRYLKPEKGNTLVVSAAAGPVGATVGQLARMAGAKVVGIAGSDEKCDWLLDQAGFDATINYKRESVSDGLDRSCADGVDLYFDNVGGAVLDAVMTRLSINARIVLCGLMEQYNTESPPPGPNPGLIIRARATVNGLVVYDHEELRTVMLNALTPLVANGRLAYRECIFNGLDEAANAFCTLMRGENFGKTLVAPR